jgi:hypothetical protein
LPNAIFQMVYLFLQRRSYMIQDKKITSKFHIWTQGTVKSYYNSILRDY